MEKKKVYHRVIVLSRYRMYVMKEKTKVKVEVCGTDCRHDDCDRHQ